MSEKNGKSKMTEQERHINNLAVIKEKCSFIRCGLDVYEKPYIIFCDHFCYLYPCKAY